jgi:hypothetical protein
MVRLCISWGKKEIGRMKVLVGDTREDSHQRIFLNPNKHLLEDSIPMSAHQ